MPLKFPVLEEPGDEVVPEVVEEPGLAPTTVVPQPAEAVAVPDVPVPVVPLVPDVPLVPVLVPPEAVEDETSNRAMEPCEVNSGFSDLPLTVTLRSERTKS